MLVALWFVFSGLAELLVSGMESARTVTGHPSLGAFTALRSHIDAGLVFFSVVLAVALALYPLARRYRLPAATDASGIQATPGGKRPQ